MPRHRSLPRTTAGLTLLLTSAFMVSDVRASAPPGRYSVGSGTLAGTVLDNETGLRWFRGMSTGNFSTATTFCATLTQSGFDDWRLPSMKELQTLVAESRHTPAIDLAAFPSTPSTFFWSSSPDAAQPGQSAWIVDFLTGYLLVLSQGQGAAARCVRP